MDDGTLPPQKPQRLHRPRVLKRATIIKSSTDSEVTCTVRNMHSDGAELKVDGLAAVPASFILYVPSDGKAYACEMRWRREDKIGVQIKGEVPKPKWHYG